MIKTPLHLARLTALRSALCVAALAPAAGLAQELDIDLSVVLSMQALGPHGSVYALDCLDGHGLVAPGCIATDPDEARLRGSYSSGLASNFSGFAEGYFGNSPMLVDPGVYFAMHAQLRQAVGASSLDETWTTRVEMKETTRLSFTPPRPELIGTPARFVLSYRFQGTGSNVVGSGISGSISAEALGTSFFNGPGGPLAACRQNPVTGLCEMPWVDGIWGGPEVEHTVALYLTAVADKIDGPSGSALQTLDYTHTLELASARAYDADGRLVDGWTLQAGGNTVLALAVPEAHPAAMLVLGAVLLAWRRRRREG